jgi:hypothetical protein
MKSLGYLVTCYGSQLGKSGTSGSGYMHEEQFRLLVSPDINLVTEDGIFIVIE